jgi:hypothetical protein
VLHALADEFGTDFLLLCSSLSAVIGGVGHVDYCGANAFLDTFAEANRGRPGVHVVSVNWNAWRDVGMAVELALPSALLAWRAEIHQAGISPAEGTDAVSRILASRLVHCAVSKEDLPELLRQNFTYTPPAAQPSDDAAVSDGAHGRPALAVEYVAPRSDVVRRLAALWQDLLGIGPIGVQDDFFQLGGHSLLGTRFISQARDAFHVPLRLRVLFEGPTIAAIAAIIVEHQSAHEAETLALLQSLDGLTEEQVEAELARRRGPRR